MPDAKLSSFLEVLRQGSFTKAASVLNLSQPAVSQHIRQLEEELDAVLFDRSERSLRLTTEGEIVAKYAKRLDNVYHNMKEALLNAKLHKKALTIGISHTAESNVIPETLALYGASKEGLTIKIISDTITNLYKKLRNYEIDLGIAEGKVTDPELNSIVLDTDQLMVIVSPNHPKAKQKQMTISELKKEKLILRLPQSNTRKLLKRHLEQMDESLSSFHVILELDNIAMTKDLIRREIGISILSRNACQDELNKGKLVALPIENLSMVREINFIYTKDFTDKELLGEISDIYRRLLRQSKTGGEK